MAQAGWRSRGMIDRYTKSRQRGPGGCRVRPVGPLGDQWRGIGGAQSTYDLINIATVILELMRNASPGVGRTITQKAPHDAASTGQPRLPEALVELEVGGMIASRVSPVLLEPLVSEELKSKSRQPASPDYGVRVPESLVSVEVTVWHWEAYAAWHRMNETIHKALSTRVMKRGVARNVRIELPLRSPQKAVEYLWSHQFCDRVCDSESGALVSERRPRATAHPSGVASDASLRR